MSKLNKKIFVFENAFEGFDLVAYNGYVKCGCQFFHVSESMKVQHLIESYELDSAKWKHIKEAITSKKEIDSADVDLTLESVVGFAVDYATHPNTAFDDDMALIRQIILDSKNPSYALDYCMAEQSEKYEEYENGYVDKELKDIIFTLGDSATKDIYHEILEMNA